MNWYNFNKLTYIGFFERRLQTLHIMLSAQSQTFQDCLSESLSFREPVLGAIREHGNKSFYFQGTGILPNYFQGTRELLIVRNKGTPISNTGNLCIKA